MNIRLPRRHQLIARIPLFCEIKPLKRPRAAFHKKGMVYQPLDNQKELFAALAPFEPLHIEMPVWIDIALQYPHPGKKSTTPSREHPVSSRIGDIDNLSKAINDALVKQKIIADDNWIVGHQITKGYADEAGAAIAIWSVHTNTVEACPWDSSFALTSAPPLTLHLPISKPG